jgi:hypothetical protein
VTVRTPGGGTWTTGPEDGRPVALLQEESPAPYTASWVATEPAEATRPARQPAPRAEPASTEQAPASHRGTPAPVGSGGRTVRPPVPEDGPARPEVFFGTEPRPVSG